MQPPAIRPRRPHGAALLEALVALGVAAFGLMGLAALQLTLSRQADLARQRSEALRLAEQQIEQLRSYASLSPTPAAPTVRWAWSDLASTPATAVDPLTQASTAYTRQADLSGDGSDAFRAVTAAVSWADRATQPQRLELRTLLAKADPAATGAVLFPQPGVGQLKRPRDRALNIPIPAQTLTSDDGRPAQSLLQLGPSLWLVFDNQSANTVRLCDHAVSTTSQAAACTSLDGLIVAGHIGTTTGDLPAALGVDLQEVVGIDRSRSFCVLQDVTDPSRGAAPMKYYLCVLATSASWSGRVRLSGLAAGADRLVCRFQYEPAQRGDANERNVQPYDGVRASLDHQNYVLADGASCPTVSGLATTLHQDCRAANPQRAVHCPA